LFSSSRKKLIICAAAVVRNTGQRYVKRRKCTKEKRTLTLIRHRSSHRRLDGRLELRRWTLTGILEKAGVVGTRSIALHESFDIFADEEVLEMADDVVDGSLSEVGIVSDGEGERKKEGDAPERP
jgi:hypothetical protein